MLPRLEAQRELADINAMSVAFGSMRRFDSQRYVGSLKRAARGAAGPARATPEALATMGVAVVVVPPEGEVPSDG